MRDNNIDYKNIREDLEEINNEVNSLLEECINDFHSMVESALLRCLEINGGKISDVQKVILPEQNKSAFRTDELIGTYTYKDEPMFRIIRKGMIYKIVFSEKYKPEKS